MNEDRASRYHRLKRRVSIVSVCWTLALFAGLLFSGGSVAIRNLAGHRALAVLFYVAIVLLLNEVGTLPLSFYSGFVLERRYGLSSEPFARWFFGQLKSFAIGLVLSTIAAALVYAFIRISPE